MVDSNGKTFVIYFEKVFKRSVLFVYENMLVQGQPPNRATAKILIITDVYNTEHY